MDLNTLFELVRGKSRGREKAKANTWQALVARVADGKLADADELVKQLEHLGKTPDELTAAVERLSQRRASAAILDKARGLEVRRDAAHHKVEAARRQLEAEQRAAYEKCEAALEPLAAELKALDLLEREARQAEAFLTETCEDPEVLDQLAQAQRELAGISKAASDARANAHKAEQQAGEATREATAAPTQGYTKDPKKIAGLLAKAKVLGSEIGPHMERFEQVSASIGPLERRVEDLRRKMLAP